MARPVGGVDPGDDHLRPGGGREFFIELAREGGLYKQPSAKVAAVLEVVTSPVESRWFWAAAGLMFGCAIGVWLDALLRRETDAIKRGTEIWCPRTMGR